MLTNIRFESWSPVQVCNWLEGLCDDSNWLNGSKIRESKLCGRDLLLLNPEQLKDLGVGRVKYQELILEAIEELKFHCQDLTSDTIQILLLRLACKSRSLQNQLARERAPDLRGASAGKGTNSYQEHKSDNPKATKQRISLDTLCSVSGVVSLVKEVTSRLNRSPFSCQDEYRSMKSLLLALSLEMTSTAQRDQFVERPNDIIEKSSKALADYCDTMVQLTKDPLLIEPYHLETVVIRKGTNESELGLRIKSAATTNRHFVDTILPLSPAKKTNKLSQGDEVLLFNQFIIGWSAQRVERLISDCSKLREVVLIVIKTPSF